LHKLFPTIHFRVYPALQFAVFQQICSIFETMGSYRFLVDIMFETHKVATVPHRHCYLSVMSVHHTPAVQTNKQKIYFRFNQHAVMSICFTTKQNTQRSK